MGQVLNQNLPHELDFIVSGHAQHARRQIPLQGAENRGAKIHLQVLVAVGLVVLVRVQPEPLA